MIFSHRLTPVFAVVVGYLIPVPGAAVTSCHACFCCCCGLPDPRASCRRYVCLMVYVLLLFQRSAYPSQCVFNHSSSCFKLPTVFQNGFLHSDFPLNFCTHCSPSHVWAPWFVHLSYIPQRRRDHFRYFAAWVVAREPPLVGFARLIIEHICTHLLYLEAVG
jgi:hypothetical protein